MKKLIFIIFLFFNLFAYSQFSTAIDSLNALIPSAKSDSVKANLFLDLGIEYFSIDNLNLSEKSFFKAKSLAKKINNLELEINITGEYVSRFIYLSSSTKGIEMTLKLKEEAKKQKNDSLLFNVYALIIQQYTILGIKMDERRTASDSMLVIAKNLNDTAQLFLSYFNLGVSSISEESISFYTVALEYANVEKDKSRISAVYNNLSAKYLETGNLDSAIICAEKAYVIAKEINKTEGMAAAYLRAANAYHFKNDFNTAIKKAKQALEIFKSTGILRRQDACLKVIAASYKKLGNYKEALEHFELIEPLQDSLNTLTQINEAKFVDKRIAYELIQKRDSIKLSQERIVSKLKLENINNVLSKEKFKRYLLYGGLAMILVFAFSLFISVQRKKKDNNIIRQQKKIVEEKNQEITDSIQYAKRIQSAILPPKKLVKEYLEHSFIIYKPKDIVAGDFYWLEHKNNCVLFAAADCTGHGVPGAMVSVVCNNALNRSVREHGLTDPGKILDKTREIVIAEFEKSDDEVKDGMDIALCTLNGNILQYAGANNPLWIIRKGEIIETKANKQPIGQFENPEPYTTHTIALEKGDTIYIFSDGYVDQFGGEKGKKFKAQAFRALLLSIQEKSMEEQQIIINQTFENWKGNLEQIDDVCVIGVKVK